MATKPWKFLRDKLSPERQDKLNQQVNQILEKIDEPWYLKELPEEFQTNLIISQIEEIIFLYNKIGFDEDFAKYWLHKNLLVFDNESALQWIKDGKGAQVIEVLESVANGLSV